MLQRRSGDETRAPTCGNCGLAEFAIYRGVAQKDPGLVSACRGGVVQFGPNSVVIRQDQVPKAIHTVYSGWLYLYRRLSNGRQQIISFVIPGDVIPLIAIFRPDMPLFYGVKSVTGARLCRFDCSLFRQQIGSDPAFAAPFQMAVGQYLDTLHRRLADMGQRSAKGQLAQLLVELYQRHERRRMIVDNSFAFPVSQQLLAKALGITKAYVNRTLSLLKADGIIQLQDHRLTILDPDGLRNIADSE